MGIFRRLLGLTKPDIAQLKASCNVAELIAVIDNPRYSDLYADARDALLEIVRSHHSQLSHSDYVRAAQYALKRMGDNYHITENLPTIINTQAAGLLDALIAVYIDVSLEMKDIMGMALIPPDYLCVRYWRDVEALFGAIVANSGNAGYQRLLETANRRLTDDKDNYWFNNATSLQQRQWKERHRQ